MAELARLQVARIDLEHTSILRWEDDGGQPIEHEHPADHSMPEVAVGNNHPMTLLVKEELEKTAASLKVE